MFDLSGFTNPIVVLVAFTIVLVARGFATGKIASVAVQAQCNQLKIGIQLRAPSTLPQPGAPFLPAPQPKH